MNHYLDSASLKDKAKEKLTGHYGILIGISLIIGLITFFSTFLISLFIAPLSIYSYIINECVIFICSVFLGVFQVGTALVYLKIASGNLATVSDIFYGFSHNIQRSLTISLVICLINLIPSLAYTIPYRIFLSTGNATFIYLMFPCFAIALLISVPLSLTYSQCNFLMMDFPSKSAGEILSLSRQIMTGQKLRLFYIEISFIPLILLAALSGIGLLWVNPYMRMTLTNYFFDIMQKEQKN